MIRAATRDASWYRHPNWRGKSLVYHVVRTDVPGEVSGCGVPVVATDHGDITVPAEFVKPEWRCQRPGCRARWPKFKEL